MYGQPLRFRPDGGARRAPPPAQPQVPYLPNLNFFQNPNFYLQNPTIPSPVNQYLQNPNFSFQNPNFPIQNPNIPIQNPVFPIQNPNIPIQSPNFPIQNPNIHSGKKNTKTNIPIQNRDPPRHRFPDQRIQSETPRVNESLERIERAVSKGRRDILDAGESVSAWKVSQSVLLTLRADSWESLGLQMKQEPSFQMQEVPSLQRLIETEAKRITSLYELEVAICKSEGVKQFEELELGPLVRHPLVVHYFSLSSDVTEPFKITSKAIVSFLLEFLDTHEGEEIDVEEFLDFIAKKRSVMSREKLCVRIQSLGMHITIIRKARRLESSPIKKYIKGLKKKSDKKSGKRPLLTSQKKQLDDRFSALSQRIKSFSSVHEDFCGKHVRFFSSSSEDDDSDDHVDEDDKDEKDKLSDCKISLENTNSSDRLSSCPYPSASEEMTRLGLKLEMDENQPASGSPRHNKSNGQSKNKRKSENLSCSVSAPHKVPKRDKVEPHRLLNESQSDELSRHEENDIFLFENSMRVFITTWKEACQEQSVAEVLERMLQFYKTSPQRRKKLRLMFSSYPYVGLLNLAVTSIKCGMWDSMYDTLQDFGQYGVANTLPEKCSEYVNIEVEPTEKDAPVIAEHVSEHKCNVTLEDIVHKVAIYFELDDDIVNNVGSYLEKQFSLLRKLRKCELWLTEQFSVKEFESLGYGEFLMFLENHESLLPKALQKCLTGGRCEKSPLEVYMLHHQLSVLLSQASNSLWENENITRQEISVLLTRQFPLISFKLVENGSMKDFLDGVRENKSSAISNCVLFSATLLEKCCIGDSLPHKEEDLLKNTGAINGVGLKAGNLGSVTSKDAIEVLLRAPMLSDLHSWSHWDLIFAPSLGPLLEWLLSEVNTKELLCLVTKDGKVLRIDHSATVDSFLEAFLQGSSFQTAVELLSLFSLYGGKRHVPVSLLKCHARQALEVLMKNSMEMEVTDCQNFLMRGNEMHGQRLLDEDTSYTFSSESYKSKNKVNRAVPAASRFLLDCLGYLPIELCGFAADVLLSGMQSVIRDAPAAILSECRQSEHRLMLHEVGLSLGIVEWIEDYRVFCSSMVTDLSGGASQVKPVSSSTGSIHIQDALVKRRSSEAERGLVVTTEPHNENSSRVCHMVNKVAVSGDDFGDDCVQHISELEKDKDAALVIESIRRQEFGLDPSLSDLERSMLKKQHARLGRALHCLSQELYSQDSHFLLELVQNADDNVYPGNVEPTLTFILQEAGIIVLNNEHGFSAQNIRALCDVGNSTKKGSGAGYIGKKGIGFKSVFRVTDAPEIHSNGFHVKFDISEGQIGFVLPTVIPPCDIDLFGRLASANIDQMDTNCWSTCVVLPFKSKLSEGSAMTSIVSMFSDLHPSLLLFLHRLHCIKFRNMLDDTLIVMRKEIMGDGITKVSIGNEKMTWFVASQKLQADVIRPDVQTTEISVAFTLQESGNGGYIPHLEQQPVFAFLPLRTYGLKFILQGDFVLPSSREEVDGNSPWNQWLLSQFPDLFVSAERSFCALSCYRENPGKAVAAFMSFVPLVGEVHGFFSSLPRMIISKLRMSNCLLLEGDNHEWVPPCKVLRNWNEQARTLLPDSLLQEHLGLGLLDKDIVLSDSLARALGIEEYGPKILLQILSCLCHTENGLKSVGLVWLSSWLNTLYTMLYRSSMQTSLNSGTEVDLINNLKKIPFIPLSDGTYGSVNEGTIWLPSDALDTVLDNEHGLKAFPKLYGKLRTVSPSLFAGAAAVDVSCYDVSVVDNLTRMLHLVGIQRLSAHEIVKMHILPAISNDRMAIGDKTLMIEYLYFVMFHLQSICPDCRVERGYIISELHNKALILTNHGYKRPAEVPIHFNKAFGNPVEVNKLVDGMDLKWHEVDVSYLTHPTIKSLSGGMMKWRQFFQELGIVDFVHVALTEKSITDISHANVKKMMLDWDMISPGSIAKDWESQELIQLLSRLSSSGDRIRSKYLLELLDTLWDDCFCDKVTGYCNLNSTGDSRSFKSSFISSLFDYRWVSSSINEELHYPKDLFYDCDAVRSILGATVPYAVPKVRSKKFLGDIGFKTQINLDDILAVLQVWRRSETPFKASIAQMSKFYTFLRNEMATSKQKIAEELCLGPFVFVPYLCGSRHEDVVPGVFYSPQEVYWHDPTGCIDQMTEIHSHSGLGSTYRSLSKTLCNIYPGLHDFFVYDCGVNEIPSSRSYLQILQELSTIVLPSQAAHTVFRVFLRWSDELKSGLLSSDDIVYLKECILKLECTVLPVVQDKWVSLHASFGLVCWCDDDELRKEFKHLDNIDFLYFGELSDSEKEMLRLKVSGLIQTLEIPALSELTTREPIYYGPADCSFTASLVNWALPYAQRYIYNVHPNKYFQLKQSGFEKLSHVRVVAVGKLFYRNVIKKSGIASKKRFECSCLLQGYVLYTTQESDSHSVFMELSRLLFDGTPELHLANFLHMITTMAESGSNEEQTEFFILNSQKIPKLPDEEPVWSLSSVTSLTENDEAFLTSCASTMINEQKFSKSKRRPGISSSWPPVDWKTAPGFSFARANGLATQAAVLQPSSGLQVRMEEVSEEIVAQIDHMEQINADSTTEGHSASLTMAACLQDSEFLEVQSYHAYNLVASDMDVTLNTPSDGPNSSTSKFGQREQLSFGTPNAQQTLLTGRLGESVAFNYFAANVGGSSVRWVNKDNETGLPFDVVVGDNEKSMEYIEVKATKSARKDWFAISMREWQFAVEKGESYSIAHVVLFGNNTAKIKVFKNPVKLFQQGKLQLAVLMPKQQKEISINP
ncbi:protein NO VEIN isoform X2 [Cornus florida]|uniref:protein NO VEIN isoform X2 n=1 Tax=Cornus florida TaxID=4283 RepID=UPI00289BE1C1|nr:protein NO VEIN isoform X2 [Cornus florida]